MINFIYSDLFLKTNRACLLLSYFTVTYSIHTIFICLYAFETGNADTELSTYIPVCTEFSDVTFLI